MVSTSWPSSPETMCTKVVQTPATFAAPVYARSGTPSPLTSPRPATLWPVSPTSESPFLNHSCAPPAPERTSTVPATGGSVGQMPKEPTTRSPTPSPSTSPQASKGCAACFSKPAGPGPLPSGAPSWPDQATSRDFGEPSEMAATSGTPSPSRSPGSATWSPAPTRSSRMAPERPERTKLCGLGAKIVPPATSRSGTPSPSRSAPRSRSVPKSAPGVPECRTQASVCAPAGAAASNAASGSSQGRPARGAMLSGSLDREGQAVGRGLALHRGRVVAPVLHRDRHAEQALIRRDGARRAGRARGPEVQRDHREGRAHEEGAALEGQARLRGAHEEH